MTQQHRSRMIKEEARFMRGLSVDLTLVDLLQDATLGTAVERKRLARLKADLKDRIYTEAIYVLTHVLIPNPQQARAIFGRLAAHRKGIMQRLNRDVGPQVAALDYMQNMCGLLKSPTVIESEKCREFTRHAILDATTLSYDKVLLESDLMAESDRSDRFSTPFSILFLDIDNLKHINDRFGHSAGTKVIVTVSRCIKNLLRKYDSVYRYGGDEFIVLLPHADRRQAQSIARRIQDRVRQKRSTEFGAMPGISIGIAEYGTEGLHSIERLTRAADRALYQAKQEGKNAIRVFNPRRRKSARPLTATRPAQAA